MNEETQRYALNLGDDGRCLSATYEKYAGPTMVIVDILPEGNLPDWKYIEGQYVYDPLPEPVIPDPEPTQLDRVEAQATYTAMMTDTLLEV